MLALDDGIQYGVKTIDDEHKHLIGFLQMAEGIAPENRSRLASQRFLSSMRGFLLKHFNSEEDLMSAISYPDIRQHMRDHSCMLSTYDIMMLDCNNEGAGSGVINFLVDWIATHVNGSDRTLGLYIRKVRNSHQVQRQAAVAGKSQACVWA